LAIKKRNVKKIKTDTTKNGFARVDCLAKEKVRI
jgi:hypothetical protein